MVDAASDAAGSSVAVEPLAATEAATALPPPSRRTKLVDVTLADEMASLKVALTAVPRLTFPAPLAGVTVETVGGVVSVPDSVALMYWRFSHEAYSLLPQFGGLPQGASSNWRYA